MIPNNYGIIRQLTRDLIALPFLQLDNCKIEEVKIEFIDNTIISGTGSVNTADGYVGAYNIDISKYDYVILPYADRGYSFNRTSGITQNVTDTYLLGPAQDITYALFKVNASTAKAHITLYEDSRNLYNVNSFLGIIMEV